MINGNEAAKMDEAPLPDYVAELINKLRQAHDVLIGIDRPILASWMLQAADYINYSERHIGESDDERTVQAKPCL